MLSWRYSGVWRNDSPSGWPGGKGGGVIQGTASEAVLVAMLAAKNRHVASMVASGCSRSEATGKLVAYTSDQAHSCVQKACMVGVWIPLHIPGYPVATTPLICFPRRSLALSLRTSALCPQTHPLPGLSPRLCWRRP